MNGDYTHLQPARPYHYKCEHGFVVNTILGLAMTFLALMVSSVVVDTGVQLNAQNQLQTAAESSALAATYQLLTSPALGASAKQIDAKNTAVNYVALHSRETFPFAASLNDITVGYVNPATMTIIKSNYTSPPGNSTFTSTGGYNAVHVKVYRDATHSGGALPTQLAAMLGVKTMDISAAATAAADNRVGRITGKVRPIYACEAQWNLAKALLDEGLASPSVRIYNDTFYIKQNNSWTVVTGCPTPSSGNWGFADFRTDQKGAPGVPTVADWFLTGYPGTVSVNQAYSTQPGNPIASGPISSALDTLIANKTVVYVPVVPTGKFTGCGSNTSVTPSAFVGFVFTGYNAKGNQANRYIEGYYVRTTCNAQTCQSDTSVTNSGISRIRLVG